MDPMVPLLHFLITIEPALMINMSVYGQQVPSSPRRNTTYYTRTLATAGLSPSQRVRQTALLSMLGKSLSISTNYSDLASETQDRCQALLQASPLYFVNKPHFQTTYPNRIASLSVGSAEKSALISYLNACRWWSVQRDKWYILYKTKLELDGQENLQLKPVLQRVQ
jgi:hypothetical protein